MAHFDETSNGTTGVVISAATADNRIRFTTLGITNASATAYTCTIYDGTAAAGTARAYFRLAAQETVFLQVRGAGQSVLPKGWFTSGSAVEFALNAGTTEVTVWGDFVREV